MKTCMAAALVLCCAWPVHAGQAADTWILSGQSNACGRGQGPGNDPNPLVQMFNGKSWVEAKEPLANMGAQDNSVGPWHTAALDVAKANLPVHLAGWASGGQPISIWDEKGAGWLGLAAAIKGAGGGQVFLWYQGESDTVGGMKCEEYQKKLQDLIARVRGSAKNPQMLVVVIQIASWSNTAQDAMPIREAERLVVAADSNALLVPALGLPCDGVHLTRDGYFELGHQIARALLHTRYQKKDVDWPGPVLDQAVPGGDAKTVLIHFAEVKKLGGVEASDFGAIDAGGNVKCAKVLAENTRVALTFERALKAPVKIVYGFGSNPKATLVDEAGNHAPAVQLELSAGTSPADKETSAPNGASGAPTKK